MPSIDSWNAASEMATPAPSTASLDAIVVAHNSGPLLTRAVESIVTSGIPQEHVVLVDSASADGAVERVSLAFTEIRVRRVENRGFAAANNEGIRMTNAEYVLLLNPDAELEAGALDALLDRAQREPDSGIVGALVLNPDETVQAGAWGRFPSLGTLLTSIPGRLLRTQPRAPSTATDVDWVTGACMLVRRAAIDSAGMMDERYFLYYEDADWCKAMHDAGWRVVLEPAARIVHRSGSSGGGMSERGSAEYRKSFYRYCEKHGLRALATTTRIGLAVRTTFGGRG